MADAPTAPSAPAAPAATPAAPAAPAAPEKDANGNPIAPASPASKGADDGKVPTTWEEIFQHPRFKQLTDKVGQYESDAENARKAEQAAARQKEIEAGNFKQVIADLTPKAERAESLEKALNDVVKAEIEQIPEERRSLVPDLPVEKKLAWIVANRAILTDAKKTNVNSPANPSGGSPEGGNQKIFTRAQIKDLKFFEANKAEILLAQREGRIRD